MKSILAFGDIHGCALAAQRAVKLAEELAVQAVFLGDYIDRGPSPMQTLEILMRAQQEHPDWIFLRGNHDQMLIDIIANPSLLYATGEVLEDLGFEYTQSEASFREWQDLSESQREHIIQFLSSTPCYYESENFIFCNAVLRDTEGESMQEKSNNELFWNYDYKPPWRGKTFVHGHLPVTTVTYKGKGINVNTSCGYKGNLSGVLLNDALGTAKKIYTITEDGYLRIKES